MIKYGILFVIYFSHLFIYIKFSLHVLKNLLLQISEDEILGQNCVRVLDTALKDLFFTKIYFIKSSLILLWTHGLLKPDVPFYRFL